MNEDKKLVKEFLILLISIGVLSTRGMLPDLGFNISDVNWFYFKIFQKVMTKF